MSPWPACSCKHSGSPQVVTEDGKMRLARAVPRAMGAVSSCHRRPGESSESRQSPRCACPGTSQEVLSGLSELCSGTGGPAVWFSLCFSVEV